MSRRPLPPRRAPSHEGGGCPTPWLQTASVPAALCDLASPRAAGHGGASGCQLLIDRDPDIIVVLTTNTHARIGLDVWAERLRSIVNAAYAEASAVT